jgi:hypothetical protein
MLEVPLYRLLWPKQRIDYVGCFIANLMAGKLDIKVPSDPHLICSKVLNHANQSTVARFQNGEIKIFVVYVRRRC